MSLRRVRKPHWVEVIGFGGTEFGGGGWEVDKTGRFVKRYWSDYRYWGHKGLGSQFELTVDDTGNVEYKLSNTNYGDLQVESLEGLSISQTKLDLGFPDGWDAHLLRIGKRKGTDILVEVWTDRASSTDSDYMMGGFWLDDHYGWDEPWYGWMGGVSGVPRLFHFIRGNTESGNDNNYDRSDGKEWTGEATYKGPALGYLLKQRTIEAPKRIDGFGQRKEGVYTHDRQRLTGAVTLEAYFGTDQEWGFVSGKINQLRLDGEATDGQFLLIPDRDIDPVHASDPNWRNDGGIVRATVGNIPLGGEWKVRWSTITEEGNQPKKAIGWAHIDRVYSGGQEVGGAYYVDDDGNTYSYEIIFGAKNDKKNK